MSATMDRRCDSPVSYNESKTGLESEDAQLIGINTAPRVRRERLRPIWLTICAAVLMSTYTAFVFILARKTVVDDQTHGGRISKCTVIH